MVTACGGQVPHLASVADSPRLHATLTVTGVFASDELDQLLGTGDRSKSGTGSDGRNWWTLEAESEGVDWPGRLDQVIQPFRDPLAAYVRFRDLHEVKAQALLVAHMSRSTPIGSFSASQVADLALIGCSLEIDLHCEPPGS